MAENRFSSESQDGVHVIHCISNLEADHEAEVEKSVKEWLLNPANLHILDLKGVLKIHGNNLRHFTKFKQALKANQKFLASINMSDTLYNTISGAGLKSVFNPFKSIEEAKKSSGVGSAKKGLKVDAEFLNPFLTATKTTLETQASLKLNPGKPFVKKTREASNIDVAGVLNLTCAQFSGSIAICFPAAVFLKIYEKMLGEVHQAINQEVQDAAGEILNIIFGQAKTMLKEKGFNLERAIPTVLAGDNLKVQFSSSSPAIVLPFESDVGTFHMEIVLDSES